MISCGSPRLPSPLKTRGNLSVGVLVAKSTLAAMFRAVHDGWQTQKVRFQPSQYVRSPLNCPNTCNGCLEGPYRALVVGVVFPVADKPVVIWLSLQYQYPT